MSDVVGLSDLLAIAVSRLPLSTCPKEVDGGQNTIDCVACADTNLDTNPGELVRTAVNEGHPEWRM